MSSFQGNTGRRYCIYCPKKCGIHFRQRRCCVIRQLFIYTRKALLSVCGYKGTCKIFPCRERRFWAWGRQTCNSRIKGWGALSAFGFRQPSAWACRMDSFKAWKSLLCACIQQHSAQRHRYGVCFHKRKDTSGLSSGRLVELLLIRRQQQRP